MKTSTLKLSKRSQRAGLKISRPGSKRPQSQLSSSLSTCSAQHLRVLSEIWPERSDMDWEQAVIDADSLLRIAHEHGITIYDICNIVSQVRAAGLLQESLEDFFYRDSLGPFVSLERDEQE